MIIINRKGVLIMEFAEHIRLARDLKKLSKSELARRVGITPQYMMDIERGKMIPAEDKIEKFVEVLDLDEYVTFKMVDKIPTRILNQAKKAYFNSEKEE
jgi:transcriptional regulator with XRE-family HTH domain